MKKVGSAPSAASAFGNNGIWLDFVKTNDITGNNFTFAGVYGREIESVCIKGNDVYRVAAFEKSTHPKKVSERIIEYVFGNISTISNYTIEYGKENLFFINEFFNSTIQLLWTNETKLDGDKIKFEVERAHYRLNQTLTDIYWGGFINDNLNNKLKEIIGFDIKKAQNAFENMLLDAIDNGIMVINFFWEERKIQIDFGSRIAINIDNFRGGLRLNLYIKDSK